MGKFMATTGYIMFRRLVSILLVIFIILSIISYFNVFIYTTTIKNINHEIKCCYQYHIKTWISFFTKTDSGSNPENSELVLYEDDSPLGPAHSLHDDIRFIGNGRFSYWGGYLYFSASDNSNPAINGKVYQLKVPLVVPLYLIAIFLLALIVLLKKKVISIKDIVLEKVKRFAINRGVVSALKKRLFVILMVFAILTQTIDLLGRTLMYMPDSGTYLLGGITIKESMDFSGLGTTRVPGYPLLLAGIFKLFERDSAFPICLIQHIMCVVVIVIVYHSALMLFYNKWLAFLCGLFSCFSFQLWSYADYVMTEIFYTFSLSLIIYFCLKYVIDKKIQFIILAIILAGIASNIRPIAQALPLLLIIPFLYLLFSGNYRKKLVTVLSVCIGLSIFFSTMLPWMIYNYRHNGYMALTKSIGLNLYSRVVEYENLINYDSPYIQDIKDTVKEKTKIEEKLGNIPLIALNSEFYYNYFFGPDAWKHHLVAFGNYVNAKGKKAYEVDEIFMHASIDCIKKYPWPYIKNTLKYIYNLSYVVEPVYLYVPGLSRIGKTDYPYKIMWDAWDDDGKGNKVVISNWGAPRLTSYTQTTSQFTIFTTLYSYMINLYHPWVIERQKKAIMLSFLYIGFIISCYKIISSKRRLAWFMFIAIVSYNIVMPMLLVPGTIRMRLPVDPFLTIFYVMGLYSVLGYIIKKCVNIMDPKNESTDLEHIHK